MHAHVNVIALASVLCAIFFPYGRMQPFFRSLLLLLLFWLCYYPSFFHAILSWHSLDELFSCCCCCAHIFCWFLFSFCFYLPHFMRPKTLIVFHFLLFAAAAALSNNNNKKSCFEDWKVPQPFFGSEEEHSLSKPISFCFSVVVFIQFK